MSADHPNRIITIVYNKQRITGMIVVILVRELVSVFDQH